MTDRPKILTRRRFLTSVGVGGSAALVAGCDALSRSPDFRGFLGTGEWLSYRIQRFVGGNALAREFTEADLSPDFRTNGNTSARDPEWRTHAAQGFANYRLAVDGLVETPQALSLAELKAMPSRTQITRHDCVEGWSAIGKWTGVPLSAVLDRAQLSPNARFIVFHCADDFRGTPYYESIDLVDAFHPQTILAYGMNDGDLPTGHGAPLRLRVERQLGYKQAKFIMRIEAVASLAAIGQGRGGFWEDVSSYNWYAGI
jgi:DMSO/TMAO reductase YedYZ molybdopterin-dependent catalytic subunit